MDTADIDALHIPAAGRAEAPARNCSATRPGLLTWVWRCLQRRRQRHRLAELPDHLLKDIGVTRREARLEARRPFWE